MALCLQRGGCFLLSDPCLKSGLESSCYCCKVTASEKMCVRVLPAQLRACKEPDLMGVQLTSLNYLQLNETKEFVIFYSSILKVPEN